MSKSLLHCPIICGLALLAAVPARADVKDGVEAWTRGDYAAAVAEWQGPAERGDADAQYNLGQAYKLGRGVSADLARAEALFARASEQGHMQASDNLGLLLFQRGERARALPHIRAAADRGEPRAQYLLGIAYFNGDSVPKDWVRAYALVSLAQQAGLPQAAPSLRQMDQYIPLDQRQKSVALAAELAAQADASRSRQVAAADLGAPASAAEPSREIRPPVVTAARPPAASSGGPKSAGADYARPRAPVAAVPIRPAAISPAPPAAEPAASPKTDAATGNWRVQLGAFGVAANADSLWNKVRNRPEIAGHPRQLVPAGKVTRLLATGFASQSAAQSACSRLSAAGFSCLVTGG